MNGSGKETGRGTEADAKILADIEHKFLQQYLSHLSQIDRAAVNFARFRVEQLKEILDTPSVDSRNKQWQEIDEMDRVHAFSETYQSAVWVLELLDPPLNSGKDGKGHVLLFLIGKGSSYVRDVEGNVRPRVVTE